jgi:condensin complex subunit 3
MPAESLKLDAIPAIFQEVQLSVSGHRKFAIQLRKIQKSCAADPGLNEQFNNLFIEVLNRVLQVKRTESCANRVTKFIEAFFRISAEKGQFDV